MTPLAFQLAKQLVTPVAKRDPFWGPNIENLRSSLYDIHCFEVSEALPMCREFGAEVSRKFPEYSQERAEFIGQYVFLPAPRTWLEFRQKILYPNCTRTHSVALLMEETTKTVEGISNITKWARVTVFTASAAGFYGYVSLESDDYYITGDKTPISYEIKELAEVRCLKGNDLFSFFLSFPHQILPVINSPKIIGRRQHMPHAGLQRKMLGAQKIIGKFPLHAWTEIKLHVTKPVEIDDGEPHEAHLTGRRALHFCRKHIRIRNGRLEYVRAHWRGDPAIGIKQSRYKIVA